MSTKIFHRYNSEETKPTQRKDPPPLDLDLPASEFIVNDVKYYIKIELDNKLQKQSFIYDEYGLYVGIWNNQTKQF